MPSQPSLYRCIDANQFPTFEAALNAGVLLSSETPQRIVLSGQLKLTSTTGSFIFPQGSEIVMADASSSIIVESGASLRLEYLQLHGCTSNWDKILAKSGATLVVVGCTIKGAIEALSVEQGAAISILGNTFLRNRTAIAIGSSALPAGGVSFTDDGGISGNVISGGYLLSTTIDLEQGSIYGIVLTNINNNLEISGNHVTSLWHVVSSDPPQYAVYSNNSKIRLTGCTFSNIPVGGALGVVNNSEVIYTGLGDQTASISNCGGGIILANSSLAITNTKIENVVTGVYNERNNINNIHYVTMDNCDIINFTRYGIIATSAVNIPLGLSEFSVKNSKFVSGVNTTTYNPYAINVSSRVITTVPKVEISNNEIIRSGNSEFQGILISLIDPTSSPSSFLRINNNSISNILSGVGIQPLFTGIIVSGSHYVTVSDNELTLAADNSTGIFVSSGFGYKIKCNMIVGAGVGIRFRSNSTSSNGLYQNTFSNCSTGLLLEESGPVKATIGVQKFGLNNWLGTPANGSNEALFQFTDFDIFDNNQINEVRKSLFIIDGSNQSTQHWASPRQINTVSDNGYWFKGESTYNFSLSCTASPLTGGGGDRVSSVEKSVQDGTFSAYLGIEANKWDAEFILLDRLTKETDLLVAGSDELLWYNSNQASTLRQLHSAYIGYMELGNDNVVGATNLLTSLSAVTTSKLHEQNMKDVLSVLLEKYIQGGGDFTESQTKKLTDVAMQCRLEGGLAVEIARGVLGITKDIDTDCGKKSEDRWSKNSQNTVLVTNISPNPAREQTQITLSDDITDGVISVYNLTGQLVGKWSMSGKTAQISTMDMNAGIYMVEISVSGKTIVHSKLSVIK